MTSQLSQSMTTVHSGPLAPPFFVESNYSALATDFVTLKESALEDLSEMISDRDPAILKELVDTFLGEATRQIQNMLRGVSAGDKSMLFLPAHSLKSSSATFGAMRLSQLSQHLENLVTDTPDKAVLSEIVDHIKDEYASVVDAMQNALAQWKE